MAKTPNKRESIKTLAKMAYHGKNYTAAQKAAEEKRRRKAKEKAEREALKAKGSILGQSRDNILDKQMGKNKADIYKVFKKGK